jgi:hypothetical protein
MRKAAFLNIYGKQLSCFLAPMSSVAALDAYSHRGLNIAGTSGPFRPRRACGEGKSSNTGERPPRARGLALGRISLDSSVSALYVSVRGPWD